MPPVEHPQLCVVIPTFNECDNIIPLLDALARTLEGHAWEAVVVDDHSPDGTAERVRSLSRQRPNIRCIERLGRRGLASACIEGFLASSAPLVAVIDADGQHDEGLLPGMIDTLQGGECDLVIGSRYLDGGSTGRLADNRVGISRLATQLSRLALSAPVSDPMSGFFMFRREALAPLFPSLSGQGFKLLLDMLISAGPSLRVTELPYTMRQRRFGDSKLDTLVALEFLLLLVQKRVGRWLPLRFMMFVSVGLTGVGVHVLTLFLAYRVAGMLFVSAQLLATLVAMTSNFLLNNLFTYRDQRLAGAGLVRGLLSFYLACGIGALINVQVADFLYQHQQGWLGAGVIGAAVGAVWNYAMTATFTWSKR